MRGARWSGDALAAVGLLAVVVVVALPYALAGPGFFADDWFHLGNARIDGWFNAAGDQQWRSRPGASAVYASTFGLLGDHPLPYYALSTGLVGAAGVLLFFIVRRFESRAISVVIALVWIIAANKTSLEIWPSTINIVLALDLLLFAVLVLVRVPTWRGDVVAIAALGIGVLTYEAIAPAGAVALVTVAWHERHEHQGRGVRLVVGGAITLGAVGVWLIVHWHPLKRGLDHWVDPAQVLPGHIGSSVFGKGAPGAVALIAVAGVTLFEIIGRLLQAEWRNERSLRLMLAGVAVIVVGTIPFVNYIYSPVGLNDRVTVVSGIGGALWIVGAGVTLRGHGGRVVWLPVVAGLVAAGLWRAEVVELYAIAADDGDRIVTDIESRFAVPPEPSLVFGPDIVVERNVLVMLHPIDMAHWIFGTRDFEVETYRGTPGFDEVDPARRVDLFSLSRLDDLSDP